MEKENYRPSLSYYHANAKGTGSAVRLELHPAHDHTEGSIFASFAAQKTISRTENGVKVFPRFDWEHKIVVRLDMNDLAAMLEVFRGYSENMCCGKGLFHRTAKSNTIIHLEHRLEPIQGYVMSLSRMGDNEDVRRIGIIFSPTEALGLSQAIEDSLGVIAFGIPQVIVRNGQNPSGTDGQDGNDFDALEAEVA